MSERKPDVTLRGFIKPETQYDIWQEHRLLPARAIRIWLKH